MFFKKKFFNLTEKQFQKISNIRLQFACQIGTNMTEMNEKL